MAITFSDDDARTVNEIQASLTTTLLRANELHVEASLAVFALVRCARILLDRYPENTRSMLAGLCARFLEGTPEAGDERMLIQ